jgi:tagatose-1,6-bisphosphate aldolase
MKAAIKSRPISKSFVWIMLSAGSCAVMFLGALSQSAQAQTSADLQTPVGSSDRDANTSGDLSNMNGLFNLLHQVQRGGIRDPYEFSNDQQQSINSEASTFRQRQAELLKQQGQTGAAPSGQIAAPDSQPIR